ncbi:MAG TPA: alpha/beta fold hydrolase [Propionibacteriaceae bacterium]|nr:alpha/beta fold hydrolase [Propionibacteriaceae bacterium]
MSEATVPQPDADNDWDTIDEAVRDQYGQVLTAGTNWFDGSELMGRLDPLALFQPLLRTSLTVASRPDKVAGAMARAAGEMIRATGAATARAVGGTSSYQPKHGKDRRFGDPAWTENAAYWWLREIYHDLEQALLDIVRDTDAPADVKQKAEFGVQLMIDAVAPTNFIPGNPAVIKKALDTGGLSLAKGARNFIHDLRTNRGVPRQVVPGAHTVGEDMALTPGKVVFRNDLMELIQYAPSTQEVHEIPLLFSPPWINKYYIMDLAPGRSLVQWAVDHGHTAFMISYRNPDEQMRHVKMDDYLISGPIAALDVVRDITGAEKVNLLGLCLGGTLTMATLAYLDAVGLDLINSATFLNTLIDFSEPGLLGVFTDEASVRRLERTMKRTGFLPKEEMQRSFNLLRTNDLIWNYAVSSWLMGEEPPAFDLLSWNNDSTRMPAEMHSFYLRSCYMGNELARGVMELAGQRLDLEKVDQDLYFLTAEQDHIAPWRSSYAGALLPGGEVRFVLSNSGHIAGIVNPPSPKSIHHVLEGDQPLPDSPDEWLAAATTHPVTWWEDWAQWIGARAGGMRKPPRMGSRKYRPTTDAPGTYVLET